MRGGRSLRSVMWVWVILLGLAPLPLQAQRGASSIPPDKIFEAIGAKEGMTVCEIGAGNGDLTIAVAKIVGEKGRVLTSELGDETLKTLRAAVAASGLAQITVVDGDPMKTNFPDATCDALFLRNVYHHFTDPRTMNKSIALALKPGGRLAVIDFGPSGGKEGATPQARAAPGPNHGVTADTIARELKDAAFEPVAQQVGEQRWFMVVVQKPKG